MLKNGVDLEVEAYIAQQTPAFGTRETRRAEACIEAVANRFRNIFAQIFRCSGTALAETEPGTPPREPIQQIEVFAKTGEEMTRQLVAYVGGTNTVFLPVNLNKLIEAMTNANSLLINPKFAEVRYDLCHELPLIEADPRQIRRMISNLVVNAREAIREKSGSIGLATEVVRRDDPILMEGGFVYAPLYGERFVSLVVEDDGDGMDVDTQSRIFDPFFTTRAHGVGLGMSEVLGVVRIHGGAIRIDSTEGRGTTVRVILPESLS
jgi:signal transduction histidine kinase